VTHHTVAKSDHGFVATVGSKHNTNSLYRGFHSIYYQHRGLSLLWDNCFFSEHLIKKYTIFHVQAVPQFWKVNFCQEALENLDDNGDINRAWETIRENIRISAKESIGLCESKSY
jgi:hypothetical protein